MAMKGRSSTFIDTIIRKFDDQQRNYIIINAHMASKPIIYCNDGFCTLTGYNRSEILQKPGWCDFLSGPLTSTIAKQHLREYLNSNEEHHIEFLCYRKSGERFICSALISPVKAENSEVLLLMLSIEDITSRKGDSKTAGFQWPSSLTGALNRIRGPKGVPSQTALTEVSSAPGSQSRKPEAERFPSERRSHIAGLLPQPAFGQLSLMPAEAAEAATSTPVTASVSTTAGTERLAVSIATVTGDESAVAEQLEAGYDPVATQLPTYTRWVDKLTTMKKKAVKKGMRWVSAESHPDHKLNTGRIPRFTILHYSPFKAIWDWLILFFVLYTAIFTPLSAAFLLHNEFGSKGAELMRANRSIEVYDVLEYVVDFMFMLDIFINFRTTYVNKSDEVVSSPSKIAIHYLKGMFLIDAVAAIPFDLLLFGSKSTETSTLVGLLKTVRLVRLVRVARKWKKVSEYGAAVLIFLMATFTLIAHWMACIWYAIASVERPYLPEPRIGWLDDLSRQTKQYYIANDTTSGPTTKSKYVTALMFTFSSLTSVGFGNIAPNTTLEKTFAIVTMLIGSMMYATIFGNVSAIIQRLYSGTARYHMEMGKVKEFIKFHQIPHPLRQRLEEYFQHAWKYTNGIDMNIVLRSFPECLQADICLHLTRNLITYGPAFKKASPGCLRQLSLKFRSSHVPPGDILVHRGDVLESLYFISRGSVEIIRDNVVLAILGKDDIFGEDPCHYKYVGKSSANVRALTYCDLHKIQREDLLDTLEMYTEFAEYFAKHLEITFNLRDEHLVVTHGPSSESDVSDELDSEPEQDPLCELPAIRIRRRRVLGSSRRRRSSVLSPTSNVGKSIFLEDRHKPAELRPQVRKVDLTKDLMSEGEDTTAGQVGGGIFEMRPDKAGLDITPANFDFSGGLEIVSGVISSWAGTNRKYHPHGSSTASTTGGEDDTHTPLLPHEQREPSRHQRKARKTSSGPTTSPPSSASKPSSSTGPKFRAKYSDHEQEIVTGHPLQIKSSSTLPELKSFQGPAKDLTPVVDERFWAETGMRLTATANRHERRINTIAERLTALESKLGNDLVGIVAMLRERHAGSTATLTEIPGRTLSSIAGPVRSATSGFSTAQTATASRPLPRMASTASDSAQARLPKRASLRSRSSVESTSDSQPQWPPPPTTEEASLNLSVGATSDDATTLPSGAEVETTTSPSSLPSDDARDSLI